MRSSRVKDFLFSVIRQESERNTHVARDLEDTREELVYGSPLASCVVPSSPACACVFHSQPRNSVRNSFSTVFNVTQFREQEIGKSNHKVQSHHLQISQNDTNNNCKSFCYSTMWKWVALYSLIQPSALKENKNMKVARQRRVYWFMVKGLNICVGKDLVGIHTNQVILSFKEQRSVQACIWSVKWAFASIQ